MSLSLSAKWTENTYIKENWLFQLYNQDSYLSFDGTNDYIDLGTTTGSSSINLSSSDDMSISFWVNFAEVGSGETVFASNSTATFSGYWIGKRSDDKIVINWGDDGGTDTADRRTFYGNTALAVNTWYHIVITTTFAQATSGTKIYINGTAESTISTSGTAPITTPTYVSDGKAYFNREDFGGTGYAGKLLLKNFGIFSGVLDQTNVTAMYNSGSFLNLSENSGNYDQSSNLKGYWEFNNGNNKAIDLTDNISPGTISGSKYGGFLGLSFYDTALESVDYYGAILNKPSIRESINLENSTAKTSNVSLSVANFKHLDDDLSAELFGGSRNYINRPVKVYIQPNDDVDLADCLQIYNGRLTNLSHNANKISLNVSAVMPWDNISIPSDKSSNGVYEPIVYGDYTNTSNPAFSTNNNLYPIPFVGTLDNNLYFSEYANIGSGHQSHFYDSQLDKFTTINSGSSATTSFNSLNCVYIPNEVSKTFRIRPETVENVSGFSNVAYAVNGSASNGTTAGATVTSTGSHSGGYNQITAQDSFKVKMPEIDGGATSITIYVFASIVQSGSIGTTSGGAISGGGTNPKCVIGVSTHSEAIIAALTRQSGSNGTTNSSGTDINLTTGANGAGSAFSVTANTINNYNATKKLDEFIVSATYYSGTGDTSTTDNYQSTWAVTIKDIIIQVTYQNDIANEPTASYAKNSNLKYLYSGTDGLTDNGWNSSSAITEIHEAHRDLLHRHTSYTKSNTPTNWSSGTNLNGSKDWDIRYWLLESTPLIKVLEKLQYEGGFIGRFNGQGDYSYIYLPDSPSAEHTLTKDDIDDIDLSITPISSVVSKMEIEYAKHPAESKHLSSATSTNSTTRAKYNIKSAENIKSVKLDANVSAPSTTPGSASAKNDDFYRYYDWILGTPKIIVQGTIVNPKYMGVDVGDIVGFSDMQVDPFGESWSGKTFMVTSTQRTPGKLNFTAREI